MKEKKTSQEFRFKNVNETRDYFLEKIEQNELMSRKVQKRFVLTVLLTIDYIEDWLILGSTITGCISTSAFASLFDIPIGITSSAIGLKICGIAAGIKSLSQ